MKPSLMPSYFLLFFLFFACDSCAQTKPSCPRDQSLALIQFNSSFSVQCSDALSTCGVRNITLSWKRGKDCCLWDGVKCDTETGNVIGLDLTCNCLVGAVPSNSTLFRLRHLRELSLSFNDLQSSPVASEFGDLTSLEILYLSDCNLTGTIPASLGNLTQLKTLALSHNRLSGLIPFSVFNLPQVEFLDFSYNNLLGSLPSQVTGLSRVVDLFLDHNFVSGRVPSWLFSLPSLSRLVLSNNKLTGPIPDPVSELVNLTLLDLSSNNLSGTFELDQLSGFGKLGQLYLSGNALLSFASASNADYSLPDLSILNLSSCNTSEFPNFVRNLPGLVTLDLSHNKIRFIDADMFVNLKNLQELDLSHNSPLSFSNINNLTLVFPLLRTLSMSSCNITQLSNFLTTQESLTSLDLSNNSIRGRITEQENNWGSNLEVLHLSNNLLTAIEYYPWKNVETLNLGSNLLEGPLLVPPVSTQIFLVSNNRLIGEIPSSICNIGFDSNILDLSRNNLSGAIPECLGYAKLNSLYLHKNHFHGNIPNFCADDRMLNTLNLNDNDFEGSVPKSLVNCENLEVLNLGNNKINDTFPHWLGTLPRLQVLALRANHFHGQISPSENGSHFSTLRILDLSHNEFSGLLPTSYFKSFKSMMDLSQVQMGYMNSYFEDSLVIAMKGVEVELKRILTIFATIDMSSNRFEGTIPETVGNLVSLNVLNFSHNHLTGQIPSALGNLATLESLDLSYNVLVGKIPSQLTDLNFLAVLNLSENQLVGLIPQGKQFNTFMNDSYVGNPGLCGFPVSKSCGRSEPPPATFDEQEADSEFGLVWKTVMMSYGCGVVLGFSAGYIMMEIRKPKWLVGMVQRAGYH
ncbi:receptor-like protein 33 [Hibiscus syriacus]|uniref:receptor-like protein 33 n=1 Tax=Hibiscus syriacus TaxID=106335 RepID=UPI00192344ED|nr:receptor-like protein 33 [Hibiscus syriacus]